MGTPSPIREMSWPESDSYQTPSSSLSSAFYSDDSMDAEPDFIIPRQGPQVVLPEGYVFQQRRYLQNCLIGVLHDEKKAPVHCIAHSGKEYWAFRWNITQRWWQSMLVVWQEIFDTLGSGFVLFLPSLSLWGFMCYWIMVDQSGYNVAMKGLFGFVSSAGRTDFSFQNDSRRTTMIRIRREEEDVKVSEDDELVDAMEVDPLLPISFVATSRLHNDFPFNTEALNASSFAYSLGSSFPTHQEFGCTS
ncbi:uncharacterized protein G2W53_007433 [Senna tora]|uniref:Uncharacterized protein n=1 Tax=Senna tora TaxID=362788 RepID=A0A835CEX4_9FABA|nr:uncharacterized protein G2W53_007433 [Senna tora]